VSMPITLCCSPMGDAALTCRIKSAGTFIASPLDFNAGILAASNN
jgi:hypothetical protein